MRGRSSRKHQSGHSRAQYGRVDRTPVYSLDYGDAKVDKFISVNTPWLGAPKGVYTLETGIFLDYLISDWPTQNKLKTLIEYFPGAHELIPGAWYDIIGDAPVFAEEGWDINQNGRFYETYNSTALFRMLNARYPNAPPIILPPGQTAREFHNYPGQDDWSKDKTKVKYYHIYTQTKEPKTVTTVVAYERIIAYDPQTNQTAYYPAWKVYRGIGDGTVPLNSASRCRFDTAARQCRSGLNLNKQMPANRFIFAASSNVSSDKQYDHNGTLNNPAFHNTVYDILFDNWDFHSGGAHSRSAANESAQSAAQSNSLQNRPIFSVDTGAPVASAEAYYLTVSGVNHVTITDAAGNSMSTATTKVIPEPLRNIVVEYLGPQTIQVVTPKDQNYTITFPSGAAGLLDIEVIQGVGNKNPIRAVRYKDLKVPTGANAQLLLTPQTIENVRYDANNDGTYETAVTPTVNIVGSAALDASAPTISFNATAEQTTAANPKTLVTVTATDAGSGVKAIRYSLNGTSFQSYTGQLAIDPGQTSTLYVFADDNAANRSTIVTYKVPVGIAGRVTTSGGAAVADVSIALSGSQAKSTITNANGYYVLWLNRGGSYQLGASKSGASFTPAQHAFSNLQNNQTANFTRGSNPSVSVSITAPVAGAAIASGANLQITAAATTTGGSITKIEFYADNNLIGTATATPYTFTWNAPAPGEHHLIAKAFNSGGASSSSSAVKVTVNNPPQVSILSPANNDSFTMPASFRIAADAADDDGSISKVEFYQNSIKLGEDLEFPYIFDVSNAAVGNHVVTVKATDSAGAVTTSSPVNLTVINPLAVSIVAPANNANYPTITNLTLKAAATGGSGSISKVDFYVLNDLVGTATTADASGHYSLQWTPVANTFYTIRVVATDSSGQTAASSISSFSVGRPKIGLTDAVPTVHGGDGDELLEPGETAHLLVKLNNYGVGAARNINATLTSSTAGITINTNQSAYSEITPGGYAHNLTPFSFTVPLSAAFGQANEFTLTVTADNLSAPQTFNFTVYSPPVPNLVLGQVAASAVGGDGDQHVEPGESGKLNVELLNNGAGPAQNLTATLTASTPGVTITSGTFPYGEISNPGGTSMPFSFSLGSSFPCGQDINFSLSVSFAGYGSPKTFNFTIETGQPGVSDTTFAYAGSSVIVPDNNPAGVNIPLQVSSVAQLLSDVKLKIGGSACSSQPDSATAGISGNVSDLTIKLTSPQGTTVTLFEPVERIDFNLCDTLLTDDAERLINDTYNATPPYSGSFKPVNPFAAFKGENANGTWILNVSDQNQIGGSTTNGGVVRAFSLVMTPSHCTPNNVSPVVSITAPANQTTYEAPASVAVEIKASDVDGTISKVEVFDGDLKLGDAMADGSSAPNKYRFYCINVPAGTHRLRAVATDNDGATSASEINLSVVNPLPSSWAISSTQSTEGSPNYSAGTFAVSSPSNSTSQDTFVYQPLFGDGRIVARIVSTDADVSLKAGIAIRETLAVDALHAAVGVDKAGKTYFQRRTAAGGSVSSTTGATVGWPYWLMLVRKGNQFNAYASEDGSSWSLVNSASITMGTNAYIGMAVSGSSSTAYFDSVSVVTAPVSLLPQVSLTAPVNNSTFNANSNLILSASASDPDDTVSKVQFYNGSSLIGEDTTSPYSFTWSNVPAGVYRVSEPLRLTARAAAPLLRGTR